MLISCFRPVKVGSREAFLYQVGALSGVHIDAMHADHMIEHAEAVILALLA